MIAEVQNTTEVIKTGFYTKDIIDLILEADRLDSETEFEIPPGLEGRDDVETAENVWKFVKSNIRYKEDDATKFQDVRTAARALQDGRCDCKCFSVTIIGIMRAMGFEDLYYRFTGSTDPKTGEKDTEYTHVYVVWKPDGHEIPIDGTFNRFGKEVPYLFKMDKKANQPKLRLLRGHNQISNNTSSIGKTLLTIGGLYLGYKLIFG